MQSSLFERTRLWAELFTQREDLEITTTLKVGPAATEIDARYPADARAFAEKASVLNFSYRLRDEFCPEDDDEDEISGFLYLTLEGIAEPAYMELDGAVVPEEDMLILEGDGEGTGEAAWYVLSEGKPAKIVWSVEELVVRASLTEYLTEGAKRGFSYVPRRWQKGGSDALFKVSAPKSTPPEDIRAALIERGAAPGMADDLIEWLGADVVLLIPRSE